MAPQSLHIENVTKTIGSSAIIQNVNLQVGAGEFLVLLGPSGSGKTTLLNMIAGLDEPTVGRIILGGRDMTAASPVQRDVGMVFQSFALYPAMSVRANIGFGLRMRGVPSDIVRQRVNGIAEMLKIDHLLERKPRQLSGGQQQRVAIGRALVRKPSLLLLDEPFSNLDTQLRSELRSELKEIHEEANSCTVVYVTHDPIDAMILGTRVAVMDGGRILQCDSPQEVYERPAHQLSASLLGGGGGGMNFLAGRLVVGDRAVGVLIGNVVIPYRVQEGNVIQDWSDGREIILGLRPEDVLLKQGGSGGIYGGKVKAIEQVGADRFAVLSLNGHRVCAKMSASMKVERGECIEISMDPAKIHLFCPQSGERI